jgi:hypothetical protein
MRLASWMLLVTLVAACGRAQAPATDAASDAEGLGNPGNRPPELLSVAIRPTQPTADHTLSAVIEVRDPDRDSLEFDVEWRVNGASYHRSADLELPAGGLARGDEVVVIVHASDGEAEVSGESAPVEIANRPPRLAGIELLPKKPSGGDNLVASPRAEDPEGDDIQFAYRWLKNGEPIPGMTAATLPAEALARGDEITVEVTPRDLIDEGSSAISQGVQIENAPPAITSSPTFEVTPPNRYAYQVRAEDADDDVPLRYELVEGPAGMKIDVVSGELTWQVPRNARGSYTIELAVSDPHGGIATQRYSIDIRWDESTLPPAAGVEEAEDEEAGEADQLDEQGAPEALELPLEPPGELPDEPEEEPSTDGDSAPSDSGADQQP